MYPAAASLVGTMFESRFGAARAAQISTKKLRHRPGRSDNALTDDARSNCVKIPVKYCYAISPWWKQRCRRLWTERIDRF